MKNEILTYLRTDRSYDSGVTLVRKYTRHPTLKRYLTLHPENDYCRGVIFEELRELAQLTRQELQDIFSVPVVHVLNGTNISGLPLSAMDVDNNDATVTKSLSRSATSNETSHQVDLTTHPVFRLNKEFPFLSKSDCPAELKILVADMITAHENYIRSHSELFTAEKKEQIQQASRDTVENYLENRRIWKEMNHYKETGVILGEHPVFERTKRFNQFRGLSIGDLIQQKSRHEHNIYVLKRNIQKQPNHKMTGSRCNTIKKLEKELTEINRILGIHEP